MIGHLYGPMNTSFSHEIELKPVPVIVMLSPEAAVNALTDEIEGTLHSVKRKLYFPDAEVFEQEVSAKFDPAHDKAAAWPMEKFAYKKLILQSSYLL